MSLVDLSAYDRPTTKVTAEGIELVDNHNGNRKTLVILNEDTDQLLVSFLKGRININSIPGKAELDAEQARQDLLDLGIETLPEKRENLLIRLVRELV